MEKIDCKVYHIPLNFLSFRALSLLALWLLPFTLYANEFVFTDRVTAITSLASDELVCFPYIHVAIHDHDGRRFSAWDRHRCLLPQVHKSEVNWTSEGFVHRADSAGRFYVTNRQAVESRVGSEQIVALTATTALAVFILLGAILYLSTLSAEYLLYALSTFFNLLININLMIPASVLGIHSVFVEGTIWPFLSTACGQINIVVVYELVGRLLKLQKGGWQMRTIRIFQLLGILTTFMSVAAYFILGWSIGESAFNTILNISRNFISASLVAAIAVILVSASHRKSLVPLYLFPAYVSLMIGGLIFIATIKLVPQPLTGTISYLLGTIFNAGLFFLGVGRAFREVDTSQKKELVAQQAELGRWAHELDSRVKERTAEIISVLESSEAAIIFFGEGGRIRQKNQHADQVIQGATSLLDLLDKWDLSAYQKEAIVSVIGEGSISWYLNEPNFPTEAIVHSRSLLLRWGMVEMNEIISGITLTITDITDFLKAEVEAKEAAKEAATLYALAQISPGSRARLLKDISLLKEVLKQHGFESNAWRGPAHTLKGNALSLGFDTLGDRIHRWESSSGQGLIVMDEMNRIEAAVLKLFGGHGGRIIDEHTAIEAIERNHADQYLRNILFVPIKDIVKENPATVASKRLAERLGKFPPAIEVYGEQIRLHPRKADALGTLLTHCIRNSIDHGLETVEVRIARGKPPAGTIFVSASLQENKIIIRIRDDGAGLNIAALRHRFGEMSDSLLAQQIFEEGVSTRDAVSDTSGRGVGMAAAKRAIEDIRGIVDVRLDPLDQGADYQKMTIVVIMNTDG